MLEGMFAIGGVAFAVWLDFGFFFLKNNSANWRFPIAFQAVFTIGIAWLIFMLPGKVFSSRPSGDPDVDQRQNHPDGISKRRITKLDSSHYLDSTACRRTQCCFDKKLK